MSDKEQTAIERLKAASEMSQVYYGAPLIICHSGGKDSVVITELARRAGIPFEVVNHHTTVDAPETVYFIRSEFKRLTEKGIQCNIEMPRYKGERVSMWSLIPIKLMPPTRLVRYCCDVLKENSAKTKNRFIATGVRWAESYRRAERGIFENITSNKERRIRLHNDNDDKRQLFESCKIKSTRAVNPIIDWANSDVWNYINSERLNINPLYCEGFYRVGCIGCPMANKKRHTEFQKYPKYKNLYLKAFEKMLERRKQLKLISERWNTAEDVFNWWMEDKNPIGQTMLDLPPIETEDW